MDDIRLGLAAIALFFVWVSSMVIISIGLWDILVYKNKEDFAQILFAIIFALIGFGVSTYLLFFFQPIKIL